MRLLLRASRLIDALNERIGWVVRWLILGSVLVSAGNATVRYSLDTSSNAWLELQWYLFSAVFLLCAGYTHLRNEHIRIDIITGRLSKKVQTWIDILGGLFFMLPMTLIIVVLSLPMVLDSFERNETSVNSPIMLRWPVKMLIPLGFGLLALQGISEIIKRVAFLRGLVPDPSEKHHGHGVEPVLEAMTGEPK